VGPIEQRERICPRSWFKMSSWLGVGLCPNSPRLHYNCIIGGYDIHSDTNIGEVTYKSPYMRFFLPIIADHFVN